MDGGAFHNACERARTTRKTDQPFFLTSVRLLPPACPPLPPKADAEVLKAAEAARAAENATLRAQLAESEAARAAAEGSLEALAAQVRRNHARLIAHL